MSGEPILILFVLEQLMHAWNRLNQVINSKIRPESALVILITKIDKMFYFILWYFFNIKWATTC